MPFRLMTVHCTCSAAALNSRLSVVNCCSEPIPAPVRRIAIRSPDCIWVSMNVCSALRTYTVLSNDSPRSSTTIASVCAIGSCADANRGDPAASRPASAAELFAGVEREARVRGAGT
jgi:hypothetical protein